MRRYLFLFLLFLPMAVLARELPQPLPMPEFTNQDAEQWFNSKPLRRADLQGKVVLLDVWTYECWNCYRSFPWLHDLEERFKDEDFQVIGIHTPEFARERKVGNVAAAIKKFELEHPVMMDNEFAYWNALNNRFWPAFYLIDKRGNLRYLHVGETHKGDRRAVAIERDINTLLREP